MALKAVIAKLEDVAEGLRGEYKEREGKFYLDLEGLDDHHGVAALKSTVEAVRGDKTKLRGQLTTLEAKLAELQTDRDKILEGAIPKDDVEKLKTSYAQQVSDLKTKLGGRADKLEAALKKNLVSDRALALASELALIPSLLAPVIAGRLQVAEADGEFSLVVLGADGKPSDGGIDALKKEILDNAEYKPILRGTQASGSGGATGNDVNPSSGGAGEDINKLSAAQYAARLKAKSRGRK